MYRMWSFLKVLVVLGVLGGAGWFIYQKVNEGPPNERDVRDVAYAIARIVGSTKTELTQTDKPSVEFQIGKLADADVETIKAGLVALGEDVTREEYVAAELILLRVFDSKPEGYVSRIEGEAWEVSGDISQMGVFEIDRAKGDKDSIAEMVAAFGPRVKPRGSWAD